MNKILKLLLAVLLVGCGSGTGYKNVTGTETKSKPVVTQITKEGQTGVMFSADAFNGFPDGTTIDATFDRELFQNMPKDIVLSMDVGQHCLDDLFLFAPVQLQTVIVRLKNAPVCFPVQEGKVAVLNIEVEPVTPVTTPTGKGSVSVTITCPTCNFGGTVTNPVTTPTPKPITLTTSPWDTTTAANIRCRVSGWGCDRTIENSPGRGLVVRGLHSQDLLKCDQGQLAEWCWEFFSYTDQVTVPTTKEFWARLWSDTTGCFSVEVLEAPPSNKGISQYQNYCVTKNWYVDVIIPPYQVTPANGKTQPVFHLGLLPNSFSVNSTVEVQYWYNFNR